MVDFSLFVADKEEGRNMVNNLQIWLNMLIFAQQSAIQGY